MNLDQESKKQPSDIDEIKKFLFRVLANWYWVLGALLVALLVAFLINRYTTRIYSVYTTILSKKYYRSTSKSAADVIQGGEYFSTEKDINREITVLKSHAIVSEAIQRLDWGISYYKMGNVLISEMYPTSPVGLIVDSLSSVVPYEVMFQCTLRPDGFRLTAEEDEYWQSAMPTRTFAYGQSHNVGGFIFQLNLHQAEYPRTSDPVIYFKINDLNQLIAEYRNKLMVSWVTKGSAVLNLSVTGPYPEKEKDFLAKIGEVIVEKSVIDKNFTAVKTIEFIDDQLSNLADSLVTLSGMLQSFKMENRDLVLGSEQLFTRINALEEKRLELLLINNYIDYLGNYIQSKSDNDIIAPNTMGVNTSLLDDLIGQYVELKMQLSTQSTELMRKSPIFKYQNQESEDMLAELERGMMESIETSRARNNFEIEQINERVTALIGDTRDVLGDEQNFAQYQRIFSLAERFYSTLLTEKLNANIAKASQEPDYEILDSPRVAGPPIQPRTSRNYTFAVVLGLGIPIGIIYLIGFLNPFVHSKDELEKFSTMPLLGLVGHSADGATLVAKSKPKSAIAESFRNLRANLQYFSKDGASSKVFMITSSISGEGKTFCSVNLAYIYAISGKKTVVVGADLRKPALSKVFKNTSKDGLSTYLAGISSYSDIVQTVMDGQFYIIHSGEIPPNPSELIVTENMAGLMKRLRKDFEIIIIDSPPIGIVSDAVELTKYVDVNLIIVRQGKTRKVALESINQMYKEQKLQNPAVVFNDIDFKKLSYGYRSYGYGYGYTYGAGHGHGYYDSDEPKPGRMKKLYRKIIGKSRR